MPSPVARAAWMICFAAASAVSEAAIESGRLQSIESLTSGAFPTSGDRVLLRGEVTLVRKHTVYIQDPTGAIAAFPTVPPRLTIGDEVEIAGDYERHGTWVAIRNAAFRKLRSGSPPAPVSLTPAQAAGGSYSGRMIDTEGKLLQKRIGEDYLSLTLEGDRQIFVATLELSSPAVGRTQLGREFEDGSIVRLVGVCARGSQIDDLNGNAFAVLLRSANDMRVVSPPPWWNLRHAAWVGCAAILLLTLLYWERHRALNLRFAGIVDERTRIARDMHDTLAQSFSGLSYLLEGISRQLNSSAGRPSIDGQLSLALQLVRHCREEAHRSIFALRSLAQNNPDLLALLLSSCDAVRHNAGGTIRGNVEGRPEPMPDETFNHLLRIGQEAICNASRYANAGEIIVTVRYETGSVTLIISDDGIGFDPASAPAVESGHFGITGMKERAGHIRARLTIVSKPNAGTTITVVAATSDKRVGAREDVREAFALDKVGSERRG